ncbi:MAG: hypothetical protein COV37_12925, partial [Bdellovibrio sp. CG11_big_fil_rev_8_21_14_0_20_39_38]
MRRIWTLLLILIFVSSCAGMKSGKYVQVGPDQNYRKLASAFKVPEWQIRQANENKAISSGDWVFIPQNWGLMGQMMNQEETGAAFARGEFLWPVPSSKRISSEFGHRWGKNHEGIDIPARRGAHILAA